MKRYINILMVALATMMTSCLTEDPRDQLYEEDIYNNANNIYINAVAVLYNYIGGSADSEGLQGTCRGIYDYNTLTTDEAMIHLFVVATGTMEVCGRICISISGVLMIYHSTILGNTSTRLLCYRTNLCISSISIAITYLRSREWPTKLRCEL